MRTIESGIYYIQNIKTNQIYIGQSIHLTERLKDHFNKLRKNKHHNKHLQNSFNKYGEENFVYGIMEYCKPDKLDEMEIAYMNLFNTQKTGFNILDGGVDAPITSRINLSNDKLKELYLGEYSSADIAKMFNCSKKTVNRRLKKIFSKEEYNKLRLKKIREKNPHRIDFDYDELKRLYLQGHSSVEIGKLYNCGHEPVSKHLRIIFGDDYESLKFNSLYKQFSDEEHKFILDSINQGVNVTEISLKLNCSLKTVKTYILDNFMSNEEFEAYKKKNLPRKYTLWDTSKVYFYKHKLPKRNKFTKCFRVGFNGFELPIGGFIEFISPEVISDLVGEFIR